MTTVLLRNNKTNREVLMSLTKAINETRSNKYTPIKCKASDGIEQLCGNRAELLKFESDA